MATRGCSWNPFGNKAVIRSWRIPHRTLRFSHNPFATNNLREQRNFRSPFRSQLRVGLNHTLQDCLRRLPTIGGRGTTQRDGGSARWRVRRSPVGRVFAVLVVLAISSRSEARQVRAELAAIVGATAAALSCPARAGWTLPGGYVRPFAGRPSAASQADRTLMVEPESAEPIWKTRSVSRSGGVPGRRGVRRRRRRGADHRAGARRATRRGGTATLAYARRVLALTEASTRWRRSCSAGRPRLRGWLWPTGRILRVDFEHTWGRGTLLPSNDEDVPERCLLRVRGRP